MCAGGTADTRGVDSGNRRVGGSRDGPASPASMGIFIGMDGPQQAWGIYIESFGRALSETARCGVQWGGCEHREILQ